MAKVGYSSRTFGYTKYAVKEYILQSIESDTDLRHEMQSVIDIANKRVNRLQSGGVISPALQALTDRHFSFKGRSWENAKIEYARAISFLQQPTSSVTGAREYGKYIQRSYGLSEKEYNKLGHDLTSKLNSIDEQSFYDKYLRNYKDFSGELEQYAQDISQQIEESAKRLSDAVQSEIDNAAEKGSQFVDDTIQNILNTLESFGT